MCYFAVNGHPLTKNMTFHYNFERKIHKTIFAEFKLVLQLICLCYISGFWLYRHEKYR